MPRIRLLQFFRERTAQLLPHLKHFARLSLQTLARLVMWRKRRVRLGILFILSAFITSELSFFLSPYFTQQTYALGSAETLLPAVSDVMAKNLSYDMKEQQFKFNAGQLPTAGVAQTSGSAMSASAHADPSKGVTVTDSTNKIDFTLKPKFQLMEGKKDGNRIIYPLRDGTGWAVYTMMGTGVKEDIVLNYAKSDKLSYEYTMGLGDGMEARLEPDGSVGVYGNTLFSGNISVGSDKDAALLQKARKNAKKDTFLFGIPAPVVVEGKQQISDVRASYSLKGEVLTVNVTDLKKGKYPISIDPTIYVVTAQQFMAGNNETNVDFDVSNKLIKKGRTTGARFDTWDTTTNLSAASWRGGTATAGGYIYSVGGTTSGSPATQSLNWAKFNTSTGTVDSANPGNGACSNWCTNSDYNLPAPRANFSLVAYNGYLYAIGGNDDSGIASANRKNTVYVAKLGANGEPRLWHPTGQAPSSLKAAYSFDDTGSPLADSSSNGNTLTCGTSCPTYSSNGGHSGGAYDFSGSNNWLTIPNESQFDFTNNFSVNFWMKTNSGFTNAWETFVAKGDSSWGTTRYNTTAEATFTTFSPGANDVHGGTVNNNAWHHVAVTYDNSYKKVYVDGVQVASSAFSATVSQNNLNVRLGFNEEFPSGDYTGWLDDVRIYSKALTPSEVQTDMNTAVSTSTPQEFWHRDSDLTSARAFSSAVAYNNRMYLIGGLSTGSDTAVSTVQVADILPNGKLGTWSTSTALTSGGPGGVYGHTSVVYNDRLYVLGGSTAVGTAPTANNAYYIKINSDGTLASSWIATSNFTTGRINSGGANAVVMGAYMYVSGGCGTVNASGYCTSILSDTQVASINADGSLDTWNTVGGVSSQRLGFGMIAWRDHIYEIGGCSAQNTTTGDCTTLLNTIVHGTVNQDGDASTVGQSVASGVAPCSGGSPTGCNLPGTANIGNMLSAAVITNGYLYVIGGCTNNGCSTTSNDVAYVAISSTGQMSRPSTCTSGSYQGGAWCVLSNVLPTSGVAAGGSVVFGGQIYVVGGLSGGGNTDRIIRASVNTDGSLGTWTSQTMSGVGATSVSYEYAYARANPASAGSNPGNLYIFGGCTTSSSAGCTAYTANVYKCNIDTAGAIGSCSTSNQLSIGTIPGDTQPGLAIMSGAVYANYIYLIGGVSPNLVDLKTTRYAKFDNNNNVVAVTGSAWVESSKQLDVGRRRSAAFGYNGYLYVVGGYDGTGGTPLADIVFIKINVSDGSLGSASEGWNESSVTINQRWGLTVPVSNSYAYVIGGCTAGASPGGCTTRTDVIQTFQLYNNDSGAPAGYSTSANTYGTNTNRIGVSSTILNGYIYAAGGCTGTSDCTTPVNTVSYAAIDPANGALGTWSNTSANLPATRAWGKLLAAGGTLYYVGGQDTDGAAQTTIYYGAPSSGNVSSWSTASNGLPNARTRFGAAVWNDRLYVVGGGSGTFNTFVYSTAGSSNTLTIPPGIGTVTIKAWGGGGAGGNGSGSSGTGGNGGGAGFAQADISVSGGDVLSINVGSGGTTNSSTSNGGNGGGFSSVVRTGSTLIQAGGGGGGGGTNGNNGGAGGNGGPGGGTGIAGSGNGSAGTAAIFNGTAGGGGGSGTSAAGGTAGSAGTSGVAGNTGAANQGGDGGGSLTNCTTAVTGRGGNGGTGAGGKGGTVASCASGGGGGGGRFGGGGGGSASNGGTRGGGGGGGGSSLTTGSNTIETIASGMNPGQSSDTLRGTAGQGGSGTTATSGAGAGTDGAVVVSYGGFTPQSTVYVSPQLSSGGNITSAWSTASTSFNVARLSPTAIAYANNLYVFGGSDGTNYFSDSQYSQINSGTGDAGSWTYSESLPLPLAGGDGFAANGYIYLLGGRSNGSTCDPVTLVAPVSANTTISSGNNPTGIGSWYETNQRYTGSRYGNAAVYNDGKAYILGGACGATLTYGSPVTQQTAILSQPQVAKYSIMFDADSDVFPSHWLLNGLDNSIGARWQLKYRSMTDPTAISGSGGAVGTNCSASAMTTWGQDTNFGDVTLMSPGIYTPKDGSGTNTNCARYFYFNISVDSSQAFGYPDDVSRGPTITDLSLRFTADPAKRLMHGRTFINGLQMPIDTPYYTN